MRSQRSEREEKIMSNSRRMLSEDARPATIDTAKARASGFIGTMALVAAMTGGCQTEESSEVPSQSRESDITDNGCTYNTPWPAKVTIAKGQPDVAIDPKKSLLITDRIGFSAVAQNLSLKKLLVDDGNYINFEICRNPVDRKGLKLKNVENFAMHPFERGAADVGTDQEFGHNKHPYTKHGTISVITNAFRDRILANWDTDPENGPFRLLAVVNRLDLAGDYDIRGGGQLAGSERRWFGEGRLVFGLNTDIDTTTPYPMTLIMEYRLPFLKKSIVGNNMVFEVDDGYAHDNGPQTDQEWIEQRSRWAMVWRELSRYERSSPEYQALLLNIVKMFAFGQNHLALRTGERVTDALTGQLTNEFEYREFYLNDQLELSTRKTRREPIRCADGTATLGDRIRNEWNDARQEFHFTFMLGDRKITGIETDELVDACNGEDDVWTNPDEALPYEQALKSGGFGLRAKFVRFKPDVPWTISNVTETQRHETAMATCSGCHATETGNRMGFHILPRLETEDARVSKFLKATGTTSATPIAGGPTYTFREMDDRREVMQSFLVKGPRTEEQLLCNRTPCKDTVYDGLTVTYPPGSEQD
jgi:hypothetical protein